MILDNSPIPSPGAMDVATLLLSARQEQLWLYYALMATAGALLGGFISYRIARQGGKEALERRLSRQRVASIYKIFDRFGFGAIIIPALLPPPMPMVPFLFAAGAMQYPLKKFLIALSLGRVTRYLILAYLGAHYGRHIITFIAHPRHPALLGILIALIVIATVAFYFWRSSTQKKAHGN
jgi:membrane protein DedA with SNARE-associated domain